MECAKMDDVKRNRVNRNRVGGSWGRKGPPRGRGGKPERAVEKR